MRCPKVLTIALLLGIVPWCLAAPPTSSPAKTLASASSAFIENRGQWDSRALYLSRTNGLNLWITQDGPVFDFHQTTSNPGVARTSVRGLVGPAVSSGVARTEEAIAKSVADLGSLPSLRGSPNGARILSEGRSPGNCRTLNSGSPGPELAERPELVEVAEGEGAKLPAPLEERRKSLATTAPIGDTKGQVVKMTFVNARLSAVEGQNQQKTKFNYFLGNDKTKWASNVPSYSQAIAQNPYNGIDIRYSIDQGAPRYDVIVKPGADPSQVGIRIEGADNTRVLANGNLELKTSLGTIEERGLTAYQDTPNGRTQVACRMVMDHNIVHFDTGPYDTNQPLVIDPLIFSTFLGGGPDGCSSVALDSSNNMVVFGVTVSDNFPITTGAYQTSNQSSSGTGFIAKLNSTGTSLLFATYLGGSSYTSPYAVALDPSGNIAVDGTTECTDFPTTPGAFQTTNTNTKNLQNSASFAAKLSPDGSKLLFGTYLSGTGKEYDGENCSGLAVDSSGNLVLCGSTGSSDFPVTSGAFQTTNNAGGVTGYVAKLSSDGTTLLASTFLGGSGPFDTCQGLTLDPSGNVVVAGNTWSTDFPTTSGAFQTQNNNSDTNITGFVAKLSSDGTSLLFSTYLGGSTYPSRDDGDGCTAVALDPSGNVVVAGDTGASDFPTTAGAFQTENGITEEGTGFVAKLSPDGTSLVFGTYLGGTGPYFDDCYTLAVDGAGNVVVGGITASPNFPVTANAIQTQNNNPYYTGFVTELSNNGKALIYGTYLGGSGVDGDNLQSVILDPSDNVIAVGNTTSADFPTTSGAYQTTFGDKATAFITKFSFWPHVLALSFTPSTVICGQPVNGLVQLSAPAGAGGQPITLSESGSTVVKVPATVNVPAGSTSAQFAIQTLPISSNSLATITATYQGSSQTSTLLVTPAALAGFSLSAPTVIGGTGTTGTITLNGVAGTATNIALSGSGPATFSSRVMVPSGSTSVTFAITTAKVASTTTETITATWDGGTKQTTLAVLPPPILASFTIEANPLEMTGDTRGIITLNEAVPVGVSISATSNNPYITIPAQPVVAAGGTTATFVIQSQQLPSQTSVSGTITVSLNGASATQSVTITPFGLAGISVSPTIFGFGQKATLTITTAHAAGSIPLTVNLSSNTAFVSVPATATIPAGENHVTVTVGAVAHLFKTITATITATMSGTTKTIAVTRD